ncbi:unnamed protein product [Gongylonema pulchrum]|uniref:ShKT domain-containing protein n=1 Tax=Gongylonema pulchrum TaxID=637853 RepID=A0A183DP12_9BILA|nr:unnamed protein product [Gongylonema pulchrum]
MECEDTDAFCRHLMECEDTDAFCSKWIAENSSKCYMVDELPNTYCRKSCSLCSTTISIPQQYDLRRVPMALISVAFLIGRWRSEFGGKALFPTIPTFTYGEELSFELITRDRRVLSALKYTAFAWDNWDLKELHSEYGFLSVANDSGTNIILLNTVMSNGE